MHKSKPKDFWMQITFSIQFRWHEYYYNGLTIIKNKREKSKMAEE